MYSVAFRFTYIHPFVPSFKWHQHSSKHNYCSNWMSDLKVQMCYDILVDCCLPFFSPPLQRICLNKGTQHLL